MLHGEIWGGRAGTNWLGEARGTLEFALIRAALPFPLPYRKGRSVCAARLFLYTDPVQSGARS